MAKSLSTKELLRRKLIGLSIKDYFGQKIPEEMFERMLKAIINRKIQTLEVWERIHAKHIWENISDAEYASHFAPETRA